MQSDVFLKLAGGTVFARRWQPTIVSSNVPLVLLHDSLGCVDLWRDFPMILAQRLNRIVVAYDRLGFGRSSPRTDSLSANFIREEAELYFPAVMSGLGISEFAVFGHSVGGAMSLMVASLACDPCRAVICESAQAFVEDRTKIGIEQARMAFEKPEQFDRLRKWHGEKARWVLDAWVQTWLSADFADWTLVPDLSRVHCPVLIIHGDQDEYGSIRFPQTICDHVSGFAEMHLLSACGHVPHRERPEIVIDLVAKFVTQHLH
jgi:pimeloyl-ACP methyl ester carboxylesterase